ncbi:MAG: hypothetical protein AAGG80_03500, partial [Pseudomonadota bacterium]
ASFENIICASIATILVEWVSIFLCFKNWRHERQPQELQEVYNFSETLNVDLKKISFFELEQLINPESSQVSEKKKEISSQP